MNASDMQLTTPRPAHVASDRVVDYDFYADHRHPATGNLHDALRKLAEDEGRGILWTPRNGGHWLINDHELIFEASRNAALFSNRVAMLPRLPAEHEPRLVPIGLDAPEHGKFRLPLMRAFAPATVNALQHDIRAFTNELIDRIAAAGRCDFVKAIAEPLPVITFMKLMGMDISRLDEFREWLVDMMSSDDDRRLDAHRKISGMTAELIELRQARREDDVISQLLDAEVDGQPVSVDDLQSYCIVLFGAGLDTVANAMSFGMNHLAGDPALQDRLRADPALIPDAVEEFLRLYGVANVVRLVTQDAEFGGVKLKAGDAVLLMLPLGNYDPKVFPDPGAFDLARDNKTHITFNTGPHRCVGSHLARVELRILYEEWFKRMPRVSHDPTQEMTFHTGQTLGMRRLPIMWNAAEAS
jgi:cytochrome P450